MQLMQFLKITFWDLASETSIQNNFLSFVDNVSMKNSQVFDPKTIFAAFFQNSHRFSRNFSRIVGKWHRSPAYIFTYEFLKSINQLEICFRRKVCVVWSLENCKNDGPNLQNTRKRVVDFFMVQISSNSLWQER